MALGSSAVEDASLQEQDQVYRPLRDEVSVAFTEIRHIIVLPYLN